jgi:hypothetical protein
MHREEKIMLGKFSKFAQNNSLSKSMNCKLAAGVSSEGRSDKENPRAPAKALPSLIFDLLLILFISVSYFFCAL